MPYLIQTTALFLKKSADLRGARHCQILLRQRALLAGHPVQQPSACTQWDPGALQCLVRAPEPFDHLLAPLWVAQALQLGACAVRSGARRGA